MKILCKLGIHRFKILKYQTVKGLMIGESIPTRKVSYCTRCGKIEYKILNLFIDPHFPRSLKWEPEITKNEHKHILRIKKLNKIL